MAKTKTHYKRYGKIYKGGNHLTSMSSNNLLKLYDDENEINQSYIYMNLLKNDDKIDDENDNENDYENDYENDDENDNENDINNNYKLYLSEESNVTDTINDFPDISHENQKLSLNNSIISSLVPSDLETNNNTKHLTPFLIGGKKTKIKRKKITKKKKKKKKRKKTKKKKFKKKKKRRFPQRN